MKRSLLTLFFLSVLFNLLSQTIAQQNAYEQIPRVLSNITADKKGELFIGGSNLIEVETFYALNNLRIEPTGTRDGIRFNFNNPEFNGTIYYGLFPEELPTYPQTVFFKRSAPIREGIAEINIAELKGKYDIANWGEKGYARLGYRIVNSFGRVIYDGKTNIEGKGPFASGLSIVEGPFLNNLSHSDVNISFLTSRPCSPYVVVDGKEYRANTRMMNPMGDVNHEIQIRGLKADTKYSYTVHYGEYDETHHFRTAPEPGSRKAFIFAYTSDSRAGKGGGERDIYGTNAYIMKRMAALATSQNAAFFQFTGDLINGYSANIGETELQYTNWKRNLESFWHTMPFNVGFGNHEALVNIFKDNSTYGLQLDKWPYHNRSAEALFARLFVNPENGPESEDGATYDPRSDTKDFPSYKENVYYYTYDNVAMVVLNSNYWYTPSTGIIPEVGGNLHGYIMDNQLSWLEETIGKLERDEHIDHVFVTIHTPAFPNGGHTTDDMWYSGNNKYRPYIAGKPHEKGIIERRDEFLDILINKSEKVLALLCGDEHNYSRTKVTRETQIYPDNYQGKKLRINRPFWQITNGSAGAPYYGQQPVPWSGSVEIFSTQYALNLFHIDGNVVKLKVINPDTLEEIEEVVLRGE
jgi:hypothetical protein